MWIWAKDIARGGGGGQLSSNCDSGGMCMSKSEDI